MRKKERENGMKKICKQKSERKKGSTDGLVMKII